MPACRKRGPSPALHHGMIHSLSMEGGVKPQHTHTTNPHRGTWNISPAGQKGEFWPAPKKRLKSRQAQLICQNKILWEGIKLKKMTKKIVAIVTMMMFIVTMMPFAAFAATTTWKLATLENSSVALKDAEAVDGEELPVLTVTAGTTVDATTVLKDENGLGGAEGKDGLLLATNGADANNAIVAVKASTYDAITDTSDATEVAKAVTKSGTDVITGVTGVARIGEVANVVDSRDFTFKAVKTGTYYILIHQTDTTAAVTNADGQPVDAPEGYTVPAAKLVVKAASAEVGDCSNVVVSADNVADVTGNYTNGYKLNFDKTFNGVAYKTVTAKFYDEKGNPVEGHKISITADNDAILLNKAEATTDYNGKITFQVRMNAKVDGNIYLACEEDGINTTIAVRKADKGMYAIEANNTGKAVEKDTTGLLTKAVTFNITNKAGDAITGTDGEKAITGSVDNVVIEKQPSTTTTNKLTPADVAVEYTTANNANAWTLKILNNKQLQVGDYVITVALDNGAKATAEFSVAKFDKKTATLELRVNDGKVVDTVVPDNGYQAKVVWVDANGIEQTAKNVSFAVTGVAVKNRTNDAVNGTFTFNVKDKYGANNESTLGTKVLVQAVEPTTKTLLETTLTVAQKGTREALKFASEAGDAAKDNKVQYTVVDENGAVVTDVNNAKVFAKVTGQTNKDAKVTATSTKVNNGVGTLTLRASEATEADIQVIVYGNNKNKIIAGTLTYTFGAKDPDADKSVVMTIGDSNFIVNNKVVTGDAAPYVKNDRTYVPIRALAESFSADVDWDNDARTVTITRGDAKVVMTVDKTTYTVNGKEATMDVAPEITGERTYVPVRFVAEALGFTVTPFYAADGTTGSVLFQI